MLAQRAVLFTKADCTRYLVNSRAPPTCLFVNTSISEYIARIIFHANLQELVFQETQFQGKRSFWGGNRKSRALTIFRRKLFTAENLMRLKFCFIDSYESYWKLILPIIHYLPSLTEFAFIDDNDVSRGPMPAQLIYTLLTVPKRLKVLTIAGFIASRIWAGCFQIRVSKGFSAESIRCFVELEEGLQQEFKHFIILSGRQQLVEELVVQGEQLHLLLALEIGDAGVAFLKGLTSFQLSENEVKFLTMQV